MGGSSWSRDPRDREDLLAVERVTRVRHVDLATRSSVLLGLAPLPVAAVALLAGYLPGGGIGGAVIVIAYVLCAVLAFRDAGTLRSRGCSSAPRGWWSLLTPLPYLVLRAVQLRAWGGGAAPLVMFVMGLAVIAAADFLYVAVMSPFA